MADPLPPRLRVVDSHTIGEPTRLVVDDPRGAEAMVGVITLPPADPGCQLGAIYFNRVGYLDMCGHATIGLAVTLGRLGRITPGRFDLETPAGVVGVTWHGGHDATFECVEPRRIRRGLAVECADGGRVTGDIATSGLWFFLCRDHGLAVVAEAIPRLLEKAWSIRQALEAAGIRGGSGWITAESELHFDPSDPYRLGLPR